MQRNSDTYQRTVELFDEVCSILAPPERISLTEFSDRYRYLPSETSAEPGKYNSKRTPFARGIMDAISDPHVRQVVVRSASQISKTEILINTVFYYSTVDPSPILMVVPREEDARTFSLERLDPSIRDSPEVKRVYADPKDRKHYQVFRKLFKGGYVAIVGSESPANLAGRPIRILLLDEVDRMPQSSGREGDQLLLHLREHAHSGIESTY
jgi:phage terminase large subunit GpA-like protein